MDESTVMDIVKFLEERLKEGGLNVLKIILFGSHAEGRATAESDIDIAIISEDFHGKDIFERAALTKAAEIMTIKKFMTPLDIITLTPGELESRASFTAGKDSETLMAEGYRGVSREGSAIADDAVKALHQIMNEVQNRTEGIDPEEIEQEVADAIREVRKQKTP